jgi:hypothetical protein
MILEMVMVRTKRRQRKLEQSLKAARSGRIHWTVRGILECLRHVHIEHTGTSENEEWEPYTEMMIYLMTKYGRPKASAYGHRMISVIDFLTEHEAKLKKAEILRPWRDGVGMDDDVLFQALAKLPFDRRKGFNFEDVMDYISRAKSPN